MAKRRRKYSPEFKAQAAPETGSRASALHIKITTHHRRGKNHDVQPMSIAKIDLRKQNVPD